MKISRLTAQCDNYCNNMNGLAQVLSDLSILRREAESEIEAAVYRPVICLILQGRK